VTTSLNLDEGDRYTLDKDCAAEFLKKALDAREVEDKKLLD